MTEPTIYTPDELRKAYNTLAAGLVHLLREHRPEDPEAHASDVLALRMARLYLRGFIEQSANMMETPPAPLPGPKKPDGDCGCPDPGKTPPQASPAPAGAKISTEVEPMAVPAGATPVKALANAK